MERLEQFLMCPNNESYSYEGALKALKVLSFECGVKVEFDKELGDLGFGLEELWYLKGRRDDIFSLIDNFIEFAIKNSG